MGFPISSPRLQTLEKSIRLFALLLILSVPLKAEEPPSSYPSPSTPAVSLEELERLNRRTTLLQWHQGLGLITLALLTGQVIVGSSLLNKAEAGEFGESFDSLRRTHLLLGVSSFLTYAGAASLALLAPGIDRSGAFDTLTIHKTLALVHGTGMILTPALGIYISQNRERLGDRYLTYLRAHQIAGITTWATLLGAFVVITLE